MKVITIAGNDYKMTSSAYTQFAYKNRTGRSLLTDLSSLTELSKDGNMTMEKVEPLLELLLNMSYVMIEEADSTQVKDGYDGFLKSLTQPLFDDTTWILEIIKLGCSPISGQLQDN